MAKYRRPGSAPSGGGKSGSVPNMQDLMAQAQKMQEEAQRIQTELSTLEYTASAGGGAVSAAVTGDKKVTQITIDPDALDPDDVEMLCDMLVAAVNEALKAAEDDAQAKMGVLTGGIPGLM